MATDPNSRYNGSLIPNRFNYNSSSPSPILNQLGQNLGLNPTAIASSMSQFGKPLGAINMGPLENQALNSWAQQGLDRVTNMPGGNQSGGGFFGGMGGVDIAQLGIAGLSTLANIILGSKQLGLAKKQFAFTKDFANANLKNSTDEYNTKIADRGRNRSHMEGSKADPNYVSKNSLSYSRVG